MFCEKCGNQIENGHAFCSKCGAPVRMVGNIPRAAAAAKNGKAPGRVRGQRAKVKENRSLKKLAVIMGAIVLLVLFANASYDAYTKMELNELRGTWQVEGYVDSNGNKTEKNDFVGLLAAMADGYWGTDIFVDDYYGQFASITVDRDEIDLQPLGYGCYRANEFWYAGETECGNYDNAPYFLEKWNLESGIKVTYLPDTQYGQLLVVGNAKNGEYERYYILTRK